MGVRKRKRVYLTASWIMGLLAPLLFSWCRKGPDTLVVDRRPLPGPFLLRMEDIPIQTADFLEASEIDSEGYVRIDFERFDTMNQGEIRQNKTAVILENPYIRLTLLPDHGKPYSLIYKVTGHEAFFLPKTAHLHRSPNRLGWWYMLGGVEYTLPDQEHGDTWAVSWDWEIMEDSPLKKTVRMHVHERLYGLKETVDISIYPDQAYYEASITIENSTAVPVHFQHWINPMWAPGGRGEITPDTEFIIPTREVYATERRLNDWMLELDPERKRLQPYADNPMRFLKGWRRSGDLLAWKLEEGFYSAFCHEADEGIVRIFPEDINPGCNIWTWGADPSEERRLLFSGDPECRGYVEMWGGITHGFDKYHILGPGEHLRWTEWMYPYVDTRGLHHATESYAATFIREKNGKCTFRLCPAGEIHDVDVKFFSSTGVHLMHVQYRSLYPMKKIPAFVVKARDDDIYCEIRRGIKCVKLNVKSTP